MKCKLFVNLALLVTTLICALSTFSSPAFAEDDREPASQKKDQRRPQADADTSRKTLGEKSDPRDRRDERDYSPTNKPEHEQAYEPVYHRDQARDVIVPRFQFSGSIGAGLNSSDELNNDSYQHQTGKSPTGLFGFHFAFFSKKHFNLLVGGDVIYVRSVDVASSSRATATYTSENWYAAPTVGVGWIPGAPNSRFQLQAKIGSGFNVSHNATLQSPGFNSKIQSQSASSSVLAFWAEASAVFLPTPNWRILGTVLAVSKTNSLLAGVAYAY